MSLFLAVAMLGSQAAAPSLPRPPLGLLFNYYRMNAFRERAQELHCDARDLDRELEGIRRQLARRYGEQPFSPPEHPPSGAAGDCSIMLMVYQRNMADFRKDAAAALSAPAAPSTPAQ